LPQFQPIRGTHDLLPEAFRRHRRVVDAARGLAERCGYAEMATPIIEFTEVFARGMGESSDVVAKEMYSLVDKGGENITLRPEYTAGICRAFVSNGLHQRLPFKVFATGPMFRFERPQKGRQRQFHQIDVEVLGAAEPAADVEVIALGFDLLAALKISDRCELELNTLGDAASRERYRGALVEYFQARSGKLSEDSQKRLARNPLRILDSKDPGDRELIKTAPMFADYCNPESQAFFAQVCAGLDELGLRYRLNPRLVRGLDYYTHTAFEFTTTTLGAQGAVIAGGRYDGLVAALGGPDIPGIGWAAGIERLALMIDEPAPAARPVALIPIGEQAQRLAALLAREWRQAGISVELAYSGNAAKRVKLANRAQARLAVFIGDDEMARGAVKLRDLDSGEESEMALSKLIDRLRASDSPNP
jgi:histidyl-tRNA synthetase